jgi:hypothetical protein
VFKLEGRDTGGALSLGVAQTPPGDGPPPHVRRKWATELAAFEWTLVPVGGGPAVTDRGSYAQVWRREPAGRWLFARELWNSTSPPVSPKGQ